jgi:hypothetical protein
VGNLRASLHRAAPKLTPSQLHSAEVVLVAFSVISALIGVALWLWMARMNRVGKSWARVLGTVFFGLQTLLLVLGLGRAGAAAGSLFAFVPWLIGLGAVVFLWRRESTDYFNASRLP